MVSQHNIKVSVIMTCHNSSAFLDEAVKSVLSQTLSDLELILIDDCSTDNTLEIAKHYQVKDNRVVVLPLSVNSGPAAARNHGIQPARGEWLGILDSDDIAMPSRFEEQMRLADSDADLIMIGSNVIFVNAKGHVLREQKYPARHGSLVRRLELRTAFPSHSSWMYKRDDVLRLSGFNTRYVRSQDYDLRLRLSEVGKIASVEKSLVKIRKHEQSISNSEDGMLQLRMGFVASVCHFLRIYGYPDPSISKHEKTWQEFISWVDKRIKEEGVFERRKFWTEKRAVSSMAQNRLTGAFRLGCRLLSSGNAIVLIRERFFGSLLPQRLAQEWMKLS